MYKSCRIKQIIFNKYATNLKTTISHRSLRISGLPLISVCVCTKRVCVRFIRFRSCMQSSATGFLMSDQRHFFSLYSYSLNKTRIFLFTAMFTVHPQKMKINLACLYSHHSLLSTNFVRFCFLIFFDFIVYDFTISILLLVIVFN